MVHIVSKLYYLVGVFWLFPLLGPLNVLQNKSLGYLTVIFLICFQQKIAFWGLFHNISRIRHTTFLLNNIVNLGISPICPLVGPLMDPITTSIPLYCIIVKFLYYYNI